MLLLLLLLPLLTPCTSTSIYSSHSDLENLYKIESRLISLLDNYISDNLHSNISSPDDTLHANVSSPDETLQNRGDVGALRRYMTKYRAGSDPAAYLHYPGNQYSLLYRFSKVWSSLDTLVGEDSQLLLYYQDCYFQDLLPEDTDIVDAASSIFRLQEMYGVPAADLAQGRSLGDGAGEELSVGVLASLVSSSFSSRDWASCEGWGQEAFLLLQGSAGQSEGYDTQAHWFDVATRYSLCLQKLGKTRLAMEVTEAIARRYRHSTVLPNTREENQQEKQKSIRYLPKQHPGSDGLALTEEELEARVEKVDEGQYRTLCRQQPPLPVDIRQHQDLLTCYYKQNTPRTVLQPIKCEEVWSSPRIVMFYDVITDEENNKLIELAVPRLERSVVARGYAHNQKVTQERISKVSWVPEGLAVDTSHVIRKLNRRLEDATELSLEGAEALQINNYGLGGMFNPHFDISVVLTKIQMEGTRPSPLAGVRIATALVYMGEVEAGGATVFIDAGARIVPVRNSAVFWYNTLPSGMPDMTTQHAGCPVLAGNKWVINKWFAAEDQAFRRRCDVDPAKRDKDARLYNGRYSDYDGRKGVKPFIRSYL